MVDTTFDQRMQSAPYATIWGLTWPQVLMMLFHFLIGFVDVWVAGRISREAQACMGVMSQAMFFLHNRPNTKIDGEGDSIPCERQFGR